MLNLRLTLESFLFAWDALKSNLLRTVLSLLGVTVGIFAIIAVFTIVDSLEANVRSSLDFVGDKIIYVSKWPFAFDSDFPWWKYFQRPVPTPREYQQLRRQLGPNNKGIALFAANSGNTFKAGSNSVADCVLQGVSYDFRVVSNVPIKEGRYFTVQEMDAARPVAIIGATIAENLFPHGNALGSQFKARGQTFTVIGVMEKEGKKLITISSNDANCIIPFGMFTKMFALSTTGFGGGPSATIAVKGRDEDVGLLDLEYEMRGVMRNIRGLKPREEDNFALNRPEMIASAVGKLFSVIGLVGGVIGSFAILVGGFGIANIMFVSVRERTNIIGIQKSLGAKNFFILFQFLFEAVFLCLIGGAAGIFLVWLVTLIPQDALPLTMSAARVVLGLLISVGIGIIAGIVPAVLAANLDPVIAIRAK
ncbi:ABC transporter permease [Hymenobacter negativus]|uniref:ABC transporter permease n=1 Tax=Hymenobacter negativus TaxID=2795026 RepID=A0ABS0QA24_9BACT|nr:MULTISPECIES: ABC transporter permease [Bacteria]MBH8559537.1 ABC transporter permease [Hymenobacter negativus]MBH8570869.1 ABC transporter permease [Hymenobacter negativus]MBR7210606.1 ABC transporter permease [Microvirga sp. STS02]